jgi:acyl-CoA thioesterase-2
MSDFPNWDMRDVLEVIALRPLGSDRFESVVAQRNHRKGQFGGQLMGLALEAASRTIDGRACHAASGYFLRAGLPDAPIGIAVDRSFDGRSFATRRVTMTQADRPIFLLDASFQRAEEGVSLSQPAPPASGPEGLLANTDLGEDFTATLSPLQARRIYRLPGVEFRAVDPRDYFVGRADGRRSVWLRAPSAAGASEATHRSLMAYLTDFVLASTATLPHEEADPGTPIGSASLNQSLWFHRPHPVDRWFRMECDTPSAVSGRGIGRADLFDETGAFIACTVQDVLIRRADGRPALTPPR